MIERFVATNPLAESLPSDGTQRYGRDGGAE
jgi:hypothetical protein